MMPSPTSKPKQKHSWGFTAIGTAWSIETIEPLGDMKRLIEKRIDDFDRTYSRFREDSLVMKISQAPGKYEFPEDAEMLIDLYKKLYDATHGAFSPLVGDILNDAGYDMNYSLKPGSVSKAPSWGEAMQWSGRHLETKAPVLLDFGAAGKGYLIDIIAGILEDNGLREYVIDGSGDIRVKGNEEIIGMENPHDQTMVIGTVPVRNASLCASATNRRAWADWHHVVDPRSAKPVNDVVATWVLAPTTIEADGVATALFFVKPELLKNWDFQFVRLLSDGSIERSSDFVGELYV